MAALSSMANEHTVHVTSATFESEILGSSEPVLIDFWAPWCGPCLALGPVLDELATTYAGKVKVAKINVDEEPGLATEFRVRGIPTLYAVHDGQVVDQMVGFGGRRALTKAFAKLAEMNEKSAAVG